MSEKIKVGGFIPSDMSEQGRRKPQALKTTLVYVSDMSEEARRGSLLIELKINKK